MTKRNWIFCARVFVALVFLGPLFIAGCGTSTSDAAREAAASAPPVIEGDYKIGVDDRVQINVWRNPDLSVIVPVRPDGKISMPLIGDVPAGGRTAPELAAAINQKLVAFVRDPTVTVTVTELRSHEFLSRVRVTGAVRTPRSMPYRPGITVLDAVLEAGGLNDFASANRTKLYRTIGGNTTTHDIELGDILNRGKLETNMKLHPGDVVAVPERLF